MDDRELIQQQMLELIYGLLSDEESAELVDRISSDGLLAREYAELKERTELLAEVARAESQPPNFDQWKREAGEDDRPTPSGRSAITWTSRTLQVVAALAACLLIGAIGYPMFSIDEQQQTIALAEKQKDLASDFLSVSVSGPSLMAAEVRNDFFVSVENAAAEPVDAEVEYTFKNPEGATVYYGLTKATNGQVVCQIPADEVSYASKLEVIAKHGKAKSELGIDVQSAPPKPIAVLQTDREIAEPGETINFRAVVLDPQTNRDQSANVDFAYSLPNQPGLNQIASAERSTLKGVAQGQMQIPADEAVRNVELAVQSPQLQNQIQQRALPVIDSRKADAQQLAQQNSTYGRAYGGAYVPPGIAEPAASQLAAKPEGGKLVAGVQNRLRYLATRDKDNLKAARTQVRGAAAKQVAGNDKPNQDYGYFEFVPEPMQDYTVEVVDDQETPLEEQIAQAQPLPAALQVNNGVAFSNQPLEVDVKVAQPNTTLALVASDGYNTIGHNLWDVGVNAPITQPVQLNLPQEATGAQRVRLYSVPKLDDESTDDTAKPQLLAERIIYRIPVQRYDIAVEGLPDTAMPGQQLDVQVNVKDEYDTPAQATLGVQMERLSEVLPTTQQPLGLEGEWFFNRRVQVPLTATSLPESIRELEQDTAWFDQVLALSTWKEEPSIPTADANGMMAYVAEEQAETLGVASAEIASGEALPVMRRSNKKIVQSEYQQAIAALHADWETRLEDVRQTSSWMLSVAGGIIVVCLIGLAVVQGMPKIGVWGPGLLIGVGALLWGMVSLNVNLTLTDAMLSKPEMVAMNDGADAVPNVVEEKTIEFADRTNAAASQMAADENAQANVVRPAMERQRSAAPSPRSQIELRSGPARFSQGEAEVAPMNGPPGGMSSGMGGFGANPMQEAPRIMRSEAAPAEPMPSAGGDFAPAAPMATPFAAADNNEQTLLPEPVLWQPRLSTDPQGQVTIPVQLPNEPGRYRLLIDAHGSGRLGTVVKYVDVVPSTPVPANVPMKKAAN